jgi:hypothetical protein
MTEKQMVNVRRNAYKYYDEIVFENDDWTKREVTLFSFQAGADYVLKNKHELKEEEQSNAKPNIVQFLKDNGAYEMFLDNLANQRPGGLFIEYLKNDLGTIHTISEAFAWNNTQEGINFWLELNGKWLKEF